MGILGYASLSTAYYFILRTRFNTLTRSGITPSNVVLQSISIVATVALIIYSSDEPYLSYYNHAHLVWMVLLISEIAKKATVVDAGNGRSRGTVQASPATSRSRW
jgi:hypothetical protein